VDTVAPGVAIDAPVVMTRKLMIAQDTGSAIRGPMRADMFFGSGYSAGEVAGRMKNGGAFTLFLPRSLAKKIPEGFFSTLFDTSIWQVIPPEYNVMQRIAGEQE